MWGFHNVFALCINVNIHLESVMIKLFFFLWTEALWSKTWCWKLYWPQTSRAPKCPLRVNQFLDLIHCKFVQDTTKVLYQQRRVQHFSYFWVLCQDFYYLENLGPVCFIPSQVCRFFSESLGIQWSCRVQSAVWSGNLKAEGNTHNSQMVGGGNG